MGITWEASSQLASGGREASRVALIDGQVGGGRHREWPDLKLSQMRTISPNHPPTKSVRKLTASHAGRRQCHYMLYTRYERSTMRHAMPVLMSRK